MLSQLEFADRLWTLRALGDRALRIDLQPQRIDPADSALVHQLNAQIMPLLEPLDRVFAVPAYGGICLRLAGRESLADLLKILTDHFAKLGSQTTDSIAAVSRPAIEIPLSAEPGADAAQLASRLSIDVDALLQRFCAASYQVAQIGFRAGFPYLLGLPAELATPRRSAPRARVPAGSIAIGGAQAGIYPNEGAGGWNLIAHTAQKMFCSSGFAERGGLPCWLQPGDSVRFVLPTAHSSELFGVAKVQVAPDA